MSGLPRRAAAPLLVRIPPPLQYAAFFGAGLLLHRLVPWSPGWVRSAPAQWTGWLLVAVAAATALAAAGFLFVNRTTIIPHGAPRRLVAGGPFAVSRNPIYVALILGYCGAALLCASLWPLLLLPAPIAILDRVVIQFEENRLKEIFADRYAEYCRRVRRWL